MTSITGAQKQYLKGLAHHLKPVVLIGKSGVTEELLEELDSALDAHELIKIRFNDLRNIKRELALEIAQRSNSAQVGMVGNIAILYREHPEPENRKIRLPAK